MEQRVIQNFETLAETALRLDALSLAEAGYAAIDAGAKLTQELRIEDGVLHIGDATHSLAGRKVFFVGIGKCAIAASLAIEKILGDRLTAGIALDVSPVKQSGLTKIKSYIGTHPLPTEPNERATEQILHLLDDCQKDDLVLMLISGGGSTLLCLNEKPMTCLDESALFTELTAHGATIQDINTVRKHTSFARGGGLAKAAYPAEVISLIISDVPGNNIEFIASGPTIQDTSTIADAEVILSRYHVIPPTAMTLIETPKEEKYFERVTNTLFITNQDALLAMQSEATRRGYMATIMNDRFNGEACEITKQIIETLHTMPPKTVLLYAGESTVTFDSHSDSDTGGLESRKGGRNQEMALAALPILLPDELLLPFASDGRDNTDHAGAIADITTNKHSQKQNIAPEEYLARHQSYDFFTATGDALVTGYTGSNVSDLIIAIKN